MITSNPPKLSIITINYNNEKGLQKTIESVLNQTFREIEYIIIDGGSTDESIGIIKNFEPHISYWISEKDSGIYNAMNKGAQVAKGEYLLFLNSGDFLYNDYLLASVIPHLSGSDIVYGNIEYDSKKQKSFPDNLTYSYLRTDLLPHQASFIRADVLRKTGCYNEKTKLCADWEFFIIAICKYSATYKHLNIIVSIYDTTGLTSKAGNYKFIKKEREKVINDNFKMFENDYKLLDTFKILKYSRLFQLFRKLGFFKFIDFSKL